MNTEKLLTARDIQCIFSVGKNRAYELMNSPGFPSIKIGGRFYITNDALNEWLALYKGREFKI